MKHNLRKIGLLGLLLLSLFVIKSIASAAPRIDTGVTMIPDEAQRLWYRSSLHTLNLGDFGGTTALLKHDNLKLKFSKGLVVGGGSKTDSTYAVIGGGKNNEIQEGKNYAGIGGGESNIVKGQYAVIGGGQGNTAQGINAVVVGGNSNNSSDELSVIVGGQSNKGLNLGVVLGGLGNTASKNSLALGQNSESNEGSFAWNATANNGNGRVNAEGGILIGTTGAIDGVNLVVGGAVKVSGDKSAAYSGEVRYVGGCFYAFDGIKWHIMNRGDEESPKCPDGFGVDEVSQYCVFGNTIVWHGDEVVGYASGYAVITGPSNPNPCDAVEKTLVCYNKNLYVKEDGSNANGYYPYCYKINKN